jgi:2-desacetyl-2-hydroxyethyl bacteriochlorophyllide A dehydrogenase
MKVLICDNPGRFSYAERPAPEPVQGNVIVKVKRIGICGTDLHAFEGTQPYFNYPRVLGHELSGTVEWAGEASVFKTGDTVSVIPYFNCGVCIACRNGLSNCCTDIKVFGVHIDGGMAEHISVPENYLLKGEAMGLDEMALIEPLAIGAHGIRRAGVGKHEFVLVMGAGPIGLGLMEFAKLAGAHVIAMDTNEMRLNFCKQQIGVAYSLNPAKPDVAEALAQITNKDMPAVIIDATGNLQAINNGFQYMAHGGRYVLVGLQKKEIVISHPEFHKREGTLMSSRNATLQDFEKVMHSIKSGLINPLKYITHRAKFTEVADEFGKWLNPARGVIKAVVEMD